MDIKQSLTDIFCEVFDEDDIVLSDELSANDVDGWDSLTHMNLIITIEVRFNIKFSPRELTSFKNVGDLMASISNKVAA